MSFLGSVRQPFERDVIQSILVFFGGVDENPLHIVFPDGEFANILSTFQFLPNHLFQLSKPFRTLRASHSLTNN